MTNFEKAIDEFRERQANVYRADQTRVVRDSHSARRSAKDHAGRWFFELVQNCEDTKAKKVEVRITDKAVYVANDGNPFSPHAIEAISGTDFTDKPVGTIGRKGVGFKAVYQITSTPQVFVSDSQGLEFNPARAEEWFCKQEINCTEGELPYQWLPFFISRSDAEAEDSVLRELHRSVTVVRLPFKSNNCRDLALKHLEDWPPYALLPFKHIEMLTVKSDDLSFSIDVERDGGFWTLRDSRGNTKTMWRVRTYPEKPDDEILAELDIDDRQRVREVVFLVAAPVNSEGKVTSVENSIKIHVFYPTEERSPVSVLMHAEFLVKSDRTAVIPVKDSKFNSWTADRLADLLVEFVNGCHDTTDPAAHLKLLAPIDSLDSSPTTSDLWNRILRSAKEKLRLPDATGSLNLTVDEARMLAVSVEKERARRILEGTPAGTRLVHESVDSNTEAKEALRKLGCRSISDNELLAIIAEQSQKKAQDPDWLWVCWYWLAYWFADKPWGNENKLRKEHLQKLPLIPIAKTVLSREAMRGRIITWRDGSSEDNIPDWVPLSFVDNWFRDRIVSLEKNDPVTELRSELGVGDPGENAVLQAVGKAIEEYWKEPKGEPGRFLDFLLASDWVDRFDPSPGVRRCPVPAHLLGDDEEHWVETCTAYFGQQWGEELLVQVYEGVKGVPWVRPHHTADTRKTRDVLEWLGVTPYPKMVADTSADAMKIERRRIENTIYGYVREIKCKPPLVLDKVGDLASLDRQQASSLLVLLTLNWETYYRGRSEITITYTPQSRWRHHTVTTGWWKRVQLELIPPLVNNYAQPAPLDACWLPDKTTQKAIGDLVPVIDLEAFGKEADKVKNWLRKVVYVRRTLDQISLEYWRKLLTDWIPKIVAPEQAAQDHRKRDTIIRWYDACLRSLEERDDVPKNALSDVSLLCHKGDTWSYCGTDSIRLADDDELANAFGQDCWQIELRPALRSQSKRYFGLRSLSEEIDVKFQLGQLLKEKSEGLQRALKDVCPYIFVWRSSQTKREPDVIRSNLLSLRVSVVETLRANLTLEGVAEKEIERNCGVQKSQLIVSANRWDNRLTFLARALAEALDVKTDADFYENLLRYGSESGRRGKLLSKGITEGDMDRLLRLFRQEADITSSAESSPQPEAPPAPGTSDASDTSQPSASSPAPSTETPSDSTKEPSAGSKEKPEPTEPKDADLELKDPETDEIVLSSGTPSMAGSGGTSFSSGEGGTHTDRDELTQEQKNEIEKCGRDASARELRKMGYSVSQMPKHNPGFDIRATRKDEELRVEVKAHRRTSKTVQLTVREFSEYNEQQRNESVKWQLWNVENLSATVSAPIRITRFDSIPKDALSAQQFALDLGKCTPIPTEEAQ